MMSWRECAAAGMTQAEAARHRGMKAPAACLAAKRQGLTFRNGRSGRDGSFFARLTNVEMADYRMFTRSKRLSRQEALVALGRTDLVKV